MKSLFVIAFTICTYALAYGQQTEAQKESNPIPNTEETTVSSIPEPLVLISEGGIKKEISKDEIGKLDISQIAFVEILLDQDSIKEYGEKARDGVMIISLKRD